MQVKNYKDFCTHDNPQYGLANYQLGTVMINADNEINVIIQGFGEDEGDFSGDRSGLERFSFNSLATAQDIMDHRPELLKELKTVSVISINPDTGMHITNLIASRIGPKNQLALVIDNEGNVSISCEMLFEDTNFNRILFEQYSCEDHYEIAKGLRVSPYMG
jgi:hypothetical protein